MIKKASRLEFDDKVKMNVIVQGLLPSIKAFVMSRSQTSLDDVKQMTELAEAVSQIDSGGGSDDSVTKCPNPNQRFSECRK